MSDCEENYFLALHLCAAKYPEKMHPQVIFKYWKNNFREQAFFNTHAKTILTNWLVNQSAIALAVLENPELSVREISKELFKSSVDYNCKFVVGHDCK